MTSLLARLREWRENAGKALPVLGGVGGVFLLALVLFSRTAGQVFTLLWYLVSLLTLVLGVIFATYTPYAITRTRGLVARWAGWLAVVATLVLWPALLQNEWLTHFFQGSLAGLGVAFVVLFVLLSLSLFFGAAIGVMAGHGRPDVELLARTGINAWGVGLLVLVFMTGVQDASDFKGFSGWVKASLPLTTLAVCLLAQRPSLHPERLARELVTWLDRRLIWHWEGRGYVRHEDLRGAALGAVAGVLALMVSATQILLPVQLQGLRLLTELRNNGYLFGTQWHQEKILQSRNRMVILEMDDASRSDALRTRSEAALQTDIIRRLSSAGALRIVLPLPALRVDRPAGDRAVSPNMEAPEPTANDVSRSIQDLAGLAAAMRAASNVTLALPSNLPSTLPAADQAYVGDLVKAARDTGQMDLETYRVSWLTAIPVRWKLDQPPVPAVLESAFRNAGKTNAGSVSIPTMLSPQYPRVDGTRVLVDYLSAQDGRDFPRTTYASVLEDRALYVRPAVLPASAALLGREQWLPSADFFRGKVVFLDPLAAQSIPTPAGRKSTMEVLAHATCTLVAGTFVEKANPALAFLLAMLGGLISGHLCVRRDPFRASWRLVLSLVLLMGLVASLFSITRLWFDPVIMFLAALGAFLLVTQLTFSLEHDALQKNRSLLQRFVAPQVVEELLEDPENKLGLGGQRQRICVLFADVRNFTPFAEQHTPEQVIEVINNYMTALTEALHAYGGLLDKYTGDGLMAIFRVTREPPDEEIRNSVRAALAMRDAAKMISARMTVRGSTALEVGLSLHYGEAVVGLVGNPNQFNYTALGHTVVVSARLQTIARGGDVVVSDAVNGALGGEFDVREGERVLVKGLSQPVLPFYVLAESRMRLQQG